MEQKDPKDMTASELLRYCYNIKAPSSCLMCHNVFNVEECEDHVCWDVFEALADKIDAELAQARKEAVNESKKPMWWFRNAIKCGYDWPEPRDGEKFRDYLHRCFLPRPRFEDGEVVGVREYEDIQGYCIYDDGEFFVTTPNRSIDYAAGERVKRPAPEALGADGKPIVEGETVYRLSDGTAWKVTKLHHSEHRISVVSVGGKGVTAGGRFLTSEYTHTLPETQERIDDDATMHPAAYCAAYGIDLGDDPDREKSTTSMIADLLRRQREYDKRKGGAE